MADGEIKHLTDAKILFYMQALQLKRVTREDLKANFRRLMKTHHSDKGGNEEVSKQITEAKRILDKCVELGIPCPVICGDGYTEPTTAFGSGYRPPNSRQQNVPTFNYEPYADYAFSRFDGEWQDPSKPFRRRPHKGANFAKSTRYSAAFNGDPFNAEDPFNTAAGRGRSRPTHYNNGYTYDEADEFIPNAEMPPDNDSQPREVRGGLLINNPLVNFALPEYFHSQVESIILNDVDAHSISRDPNFSGIVEMLSCFDQNPGFDTLLQRTKTFIYLDWMDALQHDRTPYMNIKLGRKNNLHFEIALPALEEDDIVDDRLKEGARIRLYSSRDKCLNAGAFVESMDLASQVVTLTFENFEFTRGEELFNSGHLVDIVMSPSVFLQKAYLRGIEGIEGLNMCDLIYPKPDFKDEELPVIEEPETRDVSENVKPKSTELVFNEDQEKAISSVVQGKDLSCPFILFGPPGTGKTATLVESIKRILALGKEKRVLVCAPSNMAADVIAETILKRGFVKKKYLFRLNSMSGDPRAVNRALEPIICKVKEKNWHYGIPVVLNLQVYRVIICTLSSSVYLNMAGGMRGYFSHILIDECGQATEQETWIPIGGLAVPGETRVALFGDPKQLGPIEQVQFTKLFGYSRSMIERLMGTPAYKSTDSRYTVMLRKNYRSHASILRAASHMFYDENLITTRDDPELYKMCEWKELPNKKFPLLFHSIRGSREFASKTGSKQNAHELSVTMDYVKKLKDHGVNSKDIGIISPYKYQTTVIRQELDKKGLNGITVNSVEGFQGSERKIIIFLTTRTESLGFIACDKRLNTSITRAQQLLIILGHEDLLSNHPSWYSFISYCKFHNGFRSSELVKEPERPTPANVYIDQGPPGFSRSHAHEFSEYGQGNSGQPQPDIKRPPRFYKKEFNESFDENADEFSPSPPEPHSAPADAFYSESGPPGFSQNHFHEFSEYGQGDSPPRAPIDQRTPRFYGEESDVPDEAFVENYDQFDTFYDESGPPGFSQSHFQEFPEYDRCNSPPPPPIDQRTPRFYREEFNVQSRAFSEHADEFGTFYAESRPSGLSQNYTHEFSEYERSDSPPPPPIVKRAPRFYKNGITIQRELPTQNADEPPSPEREPDIAASERVYMDRGHPGSLQSHIHDVPECRQESSPQPEPVVKRPPRFYKTGVNETPVQSADRPSGIERESVKHESRPGANLQEAEDCQEANEVVENEDEVEVNMYDIPHYLSDLAAIIRQRLREVEF